MSPALRAGVLVAIAVAIVAGAAWVLDTPENEGKGGEAPRRWHSSAQCKECHQQEYEEWHGSHHQIAYTNPEVRALSEDFKIKECQACHLPRPVSQTGFEKRTLPRNTNPLDGVDCLTCHLAADGGLMSRNSRPDVPCAPVANQDFASVKLCASCHNQHKTTDQWKASEYAKDPDSCVQCHMPKGSHGFPGAHDITYLRAAAEFEAQRAGSELVLSLHNKGAGHNFPTEERHRAVDMEYRFVVEGEEPGAWQRAFRFRQPYRDEPGENTQLPAGQAKAVRVPVPDGASHAETRLWYRLKPHAKDDDPASTLLFEKQVDLR